MLNNDCDFVQIGDEWNDSVLQVFVLMYADHTAILAEGERGMSDVLKTVETYCDRWKLDINCRKTKITLLTKTKEEDSKIEKK